MAKGPCRGTHQVVANTVTGRDQIERHVRFINDHAGLLVLQVALSRRDVLLRRVFGVRPELVDVVHVEPIYLYPVHVLEILQVFEAHRVFGLLLGERANLLRDRATVLLELLQVFSVYKFMAIGALADQPVQVCVEEGRRRLLNLLGPLDALLLARFKALLAHGARLRQRVRAVFGVGPVAARTIAPALRAAIRALEVDLHFVFDPVRWHLHQGQD